MPRASGEFGSKAAKPASTPHHAPRRTTTIAQRTLKPERPSRAASLAVACAKAPPAAERAASLHSRPRRQQERHPGPGQDHEGGRDEDRSGGPSARTEPGEPGSAPLATHTGVLEEERRRCVCPQQVADTTKPPDPEQSSQDPVMEKPDPLRRRRRPPDLLEERRVGRNCSRRPVF